MHIAARCFFLRSLSMASHDTTPSSAFRKPKLESSRKLLYGETHVIQSIGEHRATIVWLHGRGDVGASWADALGDLPLQNTKWIVPTAPIQPITAMGGYRCNASFCAFQEGFDGRPLSQGWDDLEGLDASAAHVAELLSKESPNIKLGVGGFSQGAATSLYTTACSIIGSYSDGTDFPCKLDITVALSGWLPSAKYIQSRFHENLKAAEQAKSYSIFVCHGTDDSVVLFKLGENSASALQSLGFSNLAFKTYDGLGHWTNTAELDDVCAFFKNRLQLQG